MCLRDTPRSYWVDFFSHGVCMCFDEREPPVHPTKSVLYFPTFCMKSPIHGDQVHLGYVTERPEVPVSIARRNCYKPMTDKFYDLLFDHAFCMIVIHAHYPHYCHTSFHFCVANLDTIICLTNTIYFCSCEKVSDSSVLCVLQLLLDEDAALLVARSLFNNKLLTGRYTL